MIAHRASTSPTSARRVNTTWCSGFVLRRVRTGRWFVGCYLIWFTLISIGVPEQLGGGGCCGKVGTSDCTCSVMLAPTGKCCRQTGSAVTRSTCCQTEIFDSPKKVSRSASCCSGGLVRVAPGTVVAPGTARAPASMVVRVVATKLAAPAIPTRAELDQCPCRSDSLPGLLQLDEPRLLGQTTQVWPSPLLFALARCNAGQRPLWVLEPAVPPPRQPVV